MPRRVGVPRPLAPAVAVALLLGGCGSTGGPDGSALGPDGWEACGPPVIAHRGEPAAAPEESIRGFRTALRHGADVLEGDVHFTRDGHPVLIHDDTVDRTTDGTGRVDQMTLRQVRRLDAGDGARVPRLRELLELGHERDARLVLELKQPGATRRQVHSFWSAVRAAGMADAVTVESFHPGNLRLVASVAPEAGTALIIDEPVSRKWVAALGDAVIPELAVATRQRVRRWHEAGLEVWVWTADTRRAWDRARAAGVDGVMTNRTRAYQHWLGRECP